MLPFIDLLHVELWIVGVFGKFSGGSGCLVLIFQLG